MTPAEIRKAVLSVATAGEKVYPGFDPDNQDFVAALKRARPALSALAGMCVLDVEVVRGLVAVAKKCQGGSNLTSELALYDALAAAEAELRRVEVRDA